MTASKVMKIKNKTANIFPFGDVLVPDVPSTNKKSFTQKDMAKYGKIMFDMGRDVERKKNRKIIRWLKSIVWCNGHDTAWIERTIEKLRENK